MMKIAILKRPLEEPKDDLSKEEAEKIYKERNEII